MASQAGVGGVRATILARPRLAKEARRGAPGFYRGAALFRGRTDKNRAGPALPKTQGCGTLRANFVHRVVEGRLPTLLFMNVLEPQSF